MAAIKKCIFALVLAFAANLALADVPAVGNPLVPGYFADPTVLYDSAKATFYIMATSDGSGFTGGPFGIWKSRDFVHWTFKRISYPHGSSGGTLGFGQGWAPALTKYNGRYYMIYSVAYSYDGWCCAADSAEGPYVNVRTNNTALIPTGGSYGDYCIDGEPFIDSDNTPYVFWGWSDPRAGRLSTDFTSIVSGTITRMRNVNTNELNHYIEAPYVLKANSRYYYMYSNGSCSDATYHVDYGISTTTPFGHYTEYPTPAVLQTRSDLTINGTGHHSMMRLGSSYYIIYHRNDIPYTTFGTGGGWHRQTCADVLTFNTNFTMAPVTPTHTGVGALGPLATTEVNIARGKTGTASSTINTQHAASLAFDDNNATHWHAATKTFPSWVQVDLGQNYTVGRSEISFEYPWAWHAYRVEYSANGTTWTMYADKTANRAAGCPIVDQLTVTARYFRLTITGSQLQSSSDEQDEFAPSVWEFKLYPPPPSIQYLQPALKKNENCTINNCSKSARGVVITLNLLEPSSVAMELYDCRGRALGKKGYQGNLQSGNHTVTLTDRTISKGVYFIRLKDNRNVQVKKIVIEK